MGGGYVHIAVGVLRNARGEVLICERPAHKLYPGEWEFPGGKVETGESCESALARELHEELGITVERAQPLIRVRHRYPELAVDLETWLVDAWSGEVRSTEHPRLAWVAAERLPKWHLLAADRPIVNALRLPRHFVITPPLATAATLLAQLEHLPPDALLRLRQPALDESRYAEQVRQLLPTCRDRGLALIIDRAPEEAHRHGAAGWHASARALRSLTSRPVAADCWFGASCHDADELACAAAVGADYALLGPVLNTPSHTDGRPLGWAAFAALARHAALPVYAVGGVGPALLETARAHGAHGVAGISAYWRDSGSAGSSGSVSAGIA